MVTKTNHASTMDSTNIGQFRRLPQTMMLASAMLTRVTVKAFRVRVNPHFHGQPSVGMGPPINNLTHFH